MKSVTFKSFFNFEEPFRKKSLLIASRVGRAICADSFPSQSTIIRHKFCHSFVTDLSAIKNVGHNLFVVSIVMDFSIKNHCSFRHNLVLRFAQIRFRRNLLCSATNSIPISNGPVACQKCRSQFVFFFW